MWQYGLFGIIALLVYSVPGWISLGLFSLKLRARLLLATPVGIALWGWQGWIFGLMHMRWLTYVYLLTFWILLIRRIYLGRTTSRKAIVHTNKFDWISIGIMCIGVAAQFLVVWHVLIPYHGSFALCCGDGRDDVWYAAITQTLVRAVPGDFPGMAGEPLKNYHAWSNLVVAEVVRIFHISQFPFQFQFSGVLLSVLLGLAVMTLSETTGAGVMFQRWLLFFLYFGGDAIYLISLFTRHTFGFPGGSLENGIQFLSNLPRSYAVVLAFAWYALWPVWRKHKTMWNTLLFALIGSSLIGFKIYLAVFVFAGLGVEALVGFFYKKYDVMWLGIITALAAAVIYLPVNKSAGGFYWTGFWIFENFIVQPGFGLSRLELARQIFFNAHKYLKAYAFDAAFVVIYVVCIFGTKLIGCIQNKKARHLLSSDMHRQLLAGFAVSAVLGSFFQQGTGGSNTFNFMVNIFILGSIYTATAMVGLALSLPKRWFGIVSAIVILLTIPRAINAIERTYEQTTNLTPLMSEDVYQAYQWISRFTKPDGIIVSLSNNTPDTMTPITALFTGRSNYLSSVGMLRLFNADTTKREALIGMLRSSKDPAVTKKILEATRITYIIIDMSDLKSSNGLLASTEVVYRNPTVAILQYKFSNE